jgi:hypothetical protein
VQVVTDAFIAQSRFNPQHSALWEQHLYNELPNWLQQFQSGQQEILVEIKTGTDTVHARVGVSDVLDALQATFQKIAQHFVQFVAHATVPVVLSDRAALIPGLAFCLKGLPLAMSGEQLAEICLRALPASAAAGNGVSYISAITRATKPARTEQAPTQPLETKPAQAGLAMPKQLLPTHILYQSQAWPLPVSASINADRLLILRAGAAKQPGELFSIEADGVNAVLHAANSDTLLAGRASTDGTRIGAGDVISVSSISAELQCIRVHR